MQLNQTQNQENLNLKPEIIEKIEKLYESCGWIDFARLYILACKYLKRPQPKELIKLLNDLDDNTIEFGNRNIMIQIESIVITKAEYYEMIIETLMKKIR